MVMVNAAMAHAKMGEQNKAEKFLVQAIKIVPDNAATHFNFGLLKAEKNRVKEAEKELKAAFRLDPRLAPTAYNLCILIAKDNPQEALSWCRKAVALNPRTPSLYPGLLPERAEGPPGCGGNPERSPGLAALVSVWPPVTGRD